MFFSILFLLLFYKQRENRKEFCYKFVSAFFFFFSWSSFFHLGFHVTGFSEKDKKKKKTDSHSLQTAFLQMMISGSPLKKESNWKQLAFWSSFFSVLGRCSVIETLVLPLHEPKEHTNERTRGGRRFLRNKLLRFGKHEPQAICEQTDRKQRKYALKSILLLFCLENIFYARTDIS